MIKYLFDVFINFLTREIWAAFIWLWVMFCFVVSLLSIGYFNWKIFTPKFIKSEKTRLYVTIILSVAICYGLINSTKFLETTYKLSSNYQ